jgi:hypothetical protein
MVARKQLLEEIGNPHALKPHRDLDRISSMSETDEAQLDAELVAELLGELLDRAPATPRATHSPFAGKPFFAYAGFARRFARLFHLTLEQAALVLGAFSDEKASFLRLGPLCIKGFAPGKGIGPAHAAFLLRCDAGAIFPEHTHGGEESTLFLSGVIRDDDSGRLYHPGDLVTMPAGSPHRLRVLPAGDCVCAVLVKDQFPRFS